MLITSRSGCAYSMNVIDDFSSNRYLYCTTLPVIELRDDPTCAKAFSSSLSTEYWIAGAREVFRIRVLPCLPFGLAAGTAPMWRPIQGELVCKRKLNDFFEPSHISLAVYTKIRNSLTARQRYLDMGSLSSTHQELPPYTTPK